MRLPHGVDICCYLVVVASQAQESCFCMPDEACDGRNVALNLTSVHGVLDCPKKNQAITYSACLITSMKVICILEIIKIFYKNSKDVGMAQKVQKQVKAVTQWSINHGPYMQECRTL